RAPEPCVGSSMACWRVTPPCAPTGWPTSAAAAGARPWSSCSHQARRQRSRDLDRGDQEDGELADGGDGGDRGAGEAAVAALGFEAEGKGRDRGERERDDAGL